MHHNNDKRGVSGDMRRLGKSEVQYLCPAVTVHHDVGGFYVAVDNILFVCRFKSGGNLACDANRFFELHRALLDPVLKRIAFDELH